MFWMLSVATFMLCLILNFSRRFCVWFVLFSFCPVVPPCDPPGSIAQFPITAQLEKREKGEELFFGEETTTAMEQTNQLDGNEHISFVYHFKI